MTLEKVDQIVGLRYIGKSMDGDKETSGVTVTEVTGEKRNIFPLQPAKENTFPQPLRIVASIQTGKPDLNRGLGLSTMAPPDVMDPVPQAVPQPKTDSTQQDKHPSRWKASLARMAFPFLTLIGVSHVPPETPANVAQTATQATNEMVQSTRQTAEGIGVFVAHQATRDNPRLEAGPSTQATIPGPLDKASVLYSAPGPISLPNK